MKKEIKFRVWNGEQMVSPDYIDRNGVAHWKENSIPQASGDLMQFTGLKDRNGDGMCIYEGDIVSLHGKVIGNKYENNELLKDTTNLLIEGFGTAYWRATEKKAMDRGCYYS